MKDQERRKQRQQEKKRRQQAVRRQWAILGGAAVMLILLIWGGTTIHAERQAVKEQQQEEAAQAAAAAAEEQEAEERRQQDRQAESEMETTMTSLESTVEELIADYDGNWSVYVEELEYENAFSIDNQGMCPDRLVKLYAIAATFGNMERETEDRADNLGSEHKAWDNEE